MNQVQIESLRDYNRLMQRKHRGWSAARLEEPCHAYSGGKRRETCTGCGKPFGDEGRYREHISYHQRCYLFKQRTAVRRAKGWPEARLREPTQRELATYYLCQWCGGPRFDEGRVYWNRAICRDCHLSDRRNYVSKWRLRTGRILKLRRRTKGLPIS